MAAMAESVSASTKHRFSALEPTKTVKTFVNVSSTQAQLGEVTFVYSTLQVSCPSADQLMVMRWN